MAAHRRHNGAQWLSWRRRLGISARRQRRVIGGIGLIGSSRGAQHQLGGARRAGGIAQLGGSSWLGIGASHRSAAGARRRRIGGSACRENSARRRRRSALK